MPQHKCPDCGERITGDFSMLAHECKRCGHMAPDGSSITCDRWLNHEGPHRGYREEQDVVVFWRNATEAEKAGAQ